MKPNQEEIEKLAEEYQHENDYLVERIQSELIPGQIRTLIKEIWKDGYAAREKTVGMKWTDVNDGLPQHTNKVLVYFGHVDNVLMARHFTQGWKVFFSDGEKFMDELNPNAELITHWKELEESTPASDAGIDWNAIEEEFCNLVIADYFDEPEDIVKWFKSCPEFSNPESPTEKLFTAEEIIKLINAYWRFDDGQQHLSSWHDKQDLIASLVTTVQLLSGKNSKTQAGK